MQSRKIFRLLCRLPGISGILKKVTVMPDPVTASPAPKPLLTREELRQYINDQGIPLGASTLDKLCMPSRNEGPEVEAWWGGRPLYSPERGPEWAKGRLTKTRIRKT
jgi:hypothetical protein